MWVDEAVLQKTSNLVGLGVVPQPRGLQERLQYVLSLRNQRGRG